MDVRNAILIGYEANSALDAGERSLADVADWGPAEDWSDWSDAKR